MEGEERDGVARGVWGGEIRDDLGLVVEVEGALWIDGSSGGAGGGDGVASDLMGGEVEFLVDL
jgi:hypothetical protein